jgi:nitrate/nitrite-specific signal transduction histidine kinase
MKLRAILTIILSLILGFVIGFVVSQEVVRYRVKDAHSMSSNESFRSRTYSIIEPAADQQSTIDSIIDIYSEKLNTIRGQMRSQYSNFFKEFHEELKPHLSEEQIKRLEEFPKNIKSRGRDTTFRQERNRSNVYKPN